jgi:ubiquinone/menaquinone biosynthesis C-methylase UbiE
MEIQSIANFYDQLAATRDKFRKKNKYYYETLTKQYRYFIPANKKVLEVGCSTGDLLSEVQPSLGVGVDVSAKTIEVARQKYPHLQFHAGTIDDLNTTEKFDYIILQGLLGELDDIQAFMSSLKRVCSKDTRIVIEYYSYLWQLMLRVGEKLGFKMPREGLNWLTASDIVNFLELSGFEFVAAERSNLMPFKFFGIEHFVNRFIAKLPIFNGFTLNHFIVARPLFEPDREFSVTVLVPCRNEKGNIEPAITRTPAFGTKQEFIFVEGWSKDGTYEEVERIMKKYPEKDIKLFKQTGKGKGDAVRFGFNKAQGEVLMILDADLTTPPEDMPKFYEALRSGKGEFINGCRLVYPMEGEAMRFLNLIANKSFGIFFSWLLGQRFKDTLCGTKVMFKHHYEELAANRHYFGDFDPFGDFDLIFGAVKMNLKVVEMPIRYKNRVYGTTQIQRFRHGLLLIQMCWFAMRKIKFL